MKTVLFSFEDENKRDQFLSIIGKLDDPVAKEVIDHVRLDPPLKSDDDRTVALWVAGRRMEEGPLSRMNERFDQEVNSHHANTELRELRGGEWKTVRSRKQQEQTT